LSSFVAFTVGALIPLVMILLPLGEHRIWVAAVAVVIGLFLTGWISAALGGAPRGRAILRNVIMGSATMIATYLIGLLFGVAGMAGAFAGGILGGLIPGAILMVLFAVMMIVTATAMIRGRKNQAAKSSAAEHTPALARILLDGFLVGIATGLVGAGGGFLIVPALNLLGGLPMAIAVGTSLLVITMKSFAGLSGYLFSVQLNWPIVLAFTATAIAGSFAGVALAGRVPERALRKGFGIFVLVVGAFVLVQELPPLFASLTAA